MAAFFEMGGYAGYVWGAYGITALALVALAVSTLRANKAAGEMVERMRPKRRKKTDEETR